MTRGTLGHDALLHRQRLMGWALSAGVLAITVGFFALMGTDAPIMRRAIFGRSITVANVAAVAIIAAFFLSIAIYGRLANLIDERLERATAP
jgi:uncharacterized membrane protein (DUF485 family)